MIVGDDSFPSGIVCEIGDDDTALVSTVTATVPSYIATERAMRTITLEARPTMIRTIER